MKLRLTTLFSLLTCMLFAGNNEDVVGAKSFGLAGNSILFKDIWSANNNPAGLAHLKSWGAGLSYQNQFLLTELAAKSIVVVYPIKNAGFGLTVRQFGFSEYQENKIGISYGQELSKKFSMGIQLNYLNTQLAEGYGSKETFSGSLGLQAKISEELSLAAVIINPSHTKLADYEDERYPTVLKLGLSYQFSKKVQVFSELVKDIEFATDIKLGVEYKAIEILHFRIGYATNPAFSSFGFGLNLKQFSLDFASGFDSNLGFSPQVSLSYVPNSSP